MHIRSVIGAPSPILAFKTIIPAQHTITAEQTVWLRAVPGIVIKKPIRLARTSW